MLPPLPPVSRLSLYQSQLTSSEIASKQRKKEADRPPLDNSFTFDSCFSYLSHPALPAPIGLEAPEPPIDTEELDPLVAQTIADYACASLLLRLPGVIPIPAFDTDVPLPAGRWITEDRTAFVPEVEALLSRPTSSVPSSAHGRTVIDVPLIVRAPSPDANSPAFKHALLSGMGVPEFLLDSKVLLVSFGGQAIPRPQTRPPSRLSSPLRRSSSYTGANGSLAAPSFEHREAGLLPQGWIAIVTGLSGGDNAIREDLPYGFFASEKDVYVPDLTWIADCVLGKLVGVSLRPQFCAPPRTGLTLRVRKSLPLGMASLLTTGVRNVLRNLVLSDSVHLWYVGEVRGGLISVE